MEGDKRKAGDLDPPCGLCLPLLESSWAGKSQMGAKLGPAALVHPPDQVAQTDSASAPTMEARASERIHKPQRGPGSPSR